MTPTLSKSEVRALAERHAGDWRIGYAGHAERAITEALRLQRERIVAALRAQSDVEQIRLKETTAEVALRDFADRLSREGEGRP